MRTGSLFKILATTHHLSFIPPFPKDPPSNSPLLAAASAEAGAAVVDEDADHDKGQAQDHRQDRPEQRRVELLAGDL